MDTCLEGPFWVRSDSQKSIKPPPAAGLGTGQLWGKELQVSEAGPAQEGGWGRGAHLLLEGVLAVEEGEEGRLANQPVVQAGVRAGPSSGGQPGPEGVCWGPSPRVQAGILGPLQVGGVGGQDEGARWGSGP